MRCKLAGRIDVRGTGNKNEIDTATCWARTAHCDITCDQAGKSADEFPDLPPDAPYPPPQTTDEPCAEPSPAEEEHGLKRLHASRRASTSGTWRHHSWHGHDSEWPRLPKHLEMRFSRSGESNSESFGWETDGTIKVWNNGLQLST